MSETTPAEKGAITNSDAPEGTTTATSKPISSSKPVSTANNISKKPVSKTGKGSPSSKPPSKVSAPAIAPSVSLDKGKGKRTAEEAEFEERNAREKKRADAAKRAQEEEEDDEEDEDDEDEEDEEEGEDESDEEVEETFEEIDPTAIRSRRTRGVKIDYTSPEALAKAGLKPGDDDDD